MAKDGVGGVGDRVGHNGSQARPASVNRPEPCTRGEP